MEDSLWSMVSCVFSSEDICWLPCFFLFFFFWFLFLGELIYFGFCIQVYSYLSVAIVKQNTFF